MQTNITSTFPDWPERYLTSNVLTRGEFPVKYQFGLHGNGTANLIIRLGNDWVNQNWEI